MDRILHEQSYMHLQWFALTPGLPRLQKRPKNLNLLFAFFTCFQKMSKMGDHGDVNKGTLHLWTTDRQGAFSLSIDEGPHAVDAHRRRSHEALPRSAAPSTSEASRPSSRRRSSLPSGPRSRRLPTGSPRCWSHRPRRSRSMST